MFANAQCDNDAIFIELSAFSKNFSGSTAGRSNIQKELNLRFFLRDQDVQGILRQVLLVSLDSIFFLILAGGVEN
jgi:hypothetical protein